MLTATAWAPLAAVSPESWDLGALGGWTYLLAAAMAFLEVGTPLGLVAPTELAVPLAGAAAGAGVVDVLPLMAVVWVAAVAGDSTGYLTGRLAGERVEGRVRRRGGRVEEQHAALVRHFARHGVATVLVGRWVPYARTGTPLVAGASGMPYPRFLAASVVGTAVWSAALCTLGYAAAASVDRVMSTAGRAGIAVLVGGAVVVVAVRLRRRAQARPAAAALAE